MGLSLFSQIRGEFKAGSCIITLSWLDYILKIKSYYFILYFNINNNYNVFK